MWRAARPVVTGLARWWVEIERTGPTPPPGPLVVSANHYAHVDPVVVALTVRRPIRFLAVDELFGSSRFFDGLTHWLGAIPMSRTRAPLGALRSALGELAAGGTVGLFPEGVRVWHWGESPPRRGAAWLARRAGVPLLPVAIAGTDLVMGRGARGIARSPVVGVVCEPIHPGDFAAERDPLAEMTRVWEERIGAALTASYHTWGFPSSPSD